MSVFDGYVNGFAQEEGVSALGPSCDINAATDDIVAQQEQMA